MTTNALRATVVVIGATFCTGTVAMSNPSVFFDWQWRADRALHQRVVVEVDRIKPEGRGLFGLRAAPSLAGSLPDAQTVDATVLLTDVEARLSAGESFQFRTPLIELKGASAGDRLALGLIDDLVVCIDHAPKDIAGTDLLVWLENAPCK